jgi:hypothetical protein
MSQVV